MTWTRAAEWGVVFAVAAGVHIAVFLRVPEGDTGDSGASGEAALSLTQMTPRLAAMIARVDLEDRMQTVPPAAAGRPTAVSTDRAARPEPQPVRPHGPMSLDVPQQVETPAARLTVAPSSALGVPSITTQDRARRSASAPDLSLRAAPQNAALPIPSEQAEPALDDARPRPATQAPRREPPNISRATARAAARDTPNAPARTSPVDTPRAQQEAFELLAALPDVDDSSPLAPGISARPAPMPDRPEPPPARRSVESDRSTAPARQQSQDRSQPTQNAQRSAGSVGGQQAGTGNSGAPSLSNAQRRNLMGQWGGQIRSRVERRKPSAGGLRGTVVLTVSVGADGRLFGVSIARSSGNARLDRLAVRTVQRAGRFPRAPRQLGSGTRRFTLPLQFSR